MDTQNDADPVREDNVNPRSNDRPVQRLPVRGFRSRMKGIEDDLEARMKKAERDLAARMKEGERDLEARMQGVDGGIEARVAELEGELDRLEKCLEDFERPADRTPPRHKREGRRRPRHLRLLK